MGTPRATTILVLALTTLALLATPQAAQAADVVVRLNLPEPLPAFVRPQHGVVSLLPDNAATGPKTTHPGRRITLQQRNFQFVPRVLALRVGDSLVIGNDDAELHSVHCHDPRSPFQVTVPPGGRIERRFERAGVFNLLCDFHLHMRAYAVVSDHPWIASLDAAGQARISGVPPGRYRVMLWHEWLEPAASAAGRKRYPLGRVIKNLEVASQAVDIDVAVRLSAMARTLANSASSPTAAAPGKRTATELARRSLASLQQALEAASRGEAERTRSHLDDVLHGHYGGPTGLEVSLRRRLHRQHLATLNERLQLAASRLQALADARDHRDHAEAEARRAIEALAAALANALAEVESPGSGDSGAGQKD